MDPLATLSLVGSIVQLLQFSAGTLSTLKRIQDTTACRNAEDLGQEIQALSDVLSEYRTVLEVLDMGGNDYHHGDYIFAGPMEEIQELVRESHVALGNINRFVDRGEGERRSGALEWLAFAHDVRELKRQLESKHPEIRTACLLPLATSQERQSQILSTAAELKERLRNHETPNFAVVDSSLSSDFLLGREHIPEARVDAGAEEHAPRKHSLHSEDQEDCLIAAVGVSKLDKIFAGSEIRTPLELLECSFLGPRDLSPPLVEVPMQRSPQFNQRVCGERCALPVGVSAMDRAFSDPRHSSSGRFPGEHIHPREHVATYHLEFCPGLTEDDTRLELIPLSESTSQRGSLIHECKCRGPSRHTRTSLKERYLCSDQRHHRYSRSRLDWDVTMAAPSALVSLACALCMHNYDANRQQQHAGFFTQQLSVWSVIDNPSPPMLVAATMTHGITTLVYYAMRPADRFRESFLCIVLISTSALGYVMGADLENVLIGILPIVTIISLLLCTLTNTLLKGCGVGNISSKRQETDVEKAVDM